MTVNIKLEPFNELIKKLEEENFPETAVELKSIMKTSWSSSSEFIGELGLIVSRFRREHKNVAPELRDLLKACLNEVRTVWPEMK